MSLRLSFNEASVETPWSTLSDETGRGWQVAYQLWGIVVLETTDYEECLTVHIALVTRERLDVLVTLTGIGYVAHASQKNVRSHELAARVSEIATDLLQQTRPTSAALAARP